MFLKDGGTAAVETAWNARWKRKDAKNGRVHKGLEHWSQMSNWHNTRETPQPTMPVQLIMAYLPKPHWWPISKTSLSSYTSWNCLRFTSLLIWWAREWNLSLCMIPWRIISAGVRWLTTIRRPPKNVTHAPRWNNGEAQLKVATVSCMSSILVCCVSCSRSVTLQSNWKAISRDHKRLLLQTHTFNHHNNHFNNAHRNNLFWTLSNYTWYLRIRVIMQWTPVCMQAPHSIKIVPWHQKLHQNALPIAIHKRIGRLNGRAVH